VLTSSARSDDRNAATASGASGFVTKTANLAAYVALFDSLDKPAA
jgi:hypothetical protein